MSDEFPSFEELQGMSDHDILVMAVQKLHSISINLCSHLKKHDERNKRKWKFAFLCFGIFLTGLVNFGFALFLMTCN
jgi:hypothetical protein